MTPDTLISTTLTLQESSETSKTYKVSDNKIQGFIDELEALKQAIYKELNTEKYECPIYSFSYGIQLENLIGKDRAYVKPEFKRRVQECLLKDARITSVDNFSFTFSGDQMLCAFDVVSIYGKITITKEVNA